MVDSRGLPTSKDAMAHFFPNLQRHSPVRWPEWRWRRAQQLVRSGRYFSRRRDDEWTGQATRYLRGLARCPDLSPSPKILRFYPEVSAAHSLHRASGTTELLVQARLLARQTSPEIAFLTGLSAGVVSAYEALFFHCRDRLDACDWVQAWAIGPGCNGKEIIPDARTTLLCFAYYGGPLVLAAVLPYLLGDGDVLSRPSDPPTTAERGVLSAWLAVTTQMLPWDAATNTKLQRILPILVEMGRNEPVPSVSAAILVQTLDSRLAEMAQGATSAPAEQPGCTFPTGTRASPRQSA